MNATEQDKHECGLAVTSVSADAAGLTLSNVDSTYAGMHGYKREELVGRPLQELLAPEYHDRLPGIIEAVNKQGHTSVELMHVRKDGSGFPVRSEVLAVRDGDGNLVCYAAAVHELANGDVPTAGPEAVEEAVVGKRHGRYRLTDRELAVLHLVAAGKTDKEIAKSIGRSPYTVHNHVRHILLKMGANSRTDATVRAIREGLV